MANNVTIDVKPSFDMIRFANQLADTYRAKGYNVNISDLNGNCSLTFEKGADGIIHILGMGEFIRANCTYNNGRLNIYFTDAAWDIKVIAMAVGFFICCVPVITGVIGTSRQILLPKNIGADAAMIATSL